MKIKNQNAKSKMTNQISKMGRVVPEELKSLRPYRLGFFTGLTGFSG
jgi:hypothetical protein